MAHNRPNVPAEEPDDRKPTAYGVPKLRRRILERLADAYADDNLELAEYERRVHAAEQATTIDELEALVADFPGNRAAPAGEAPSAVVAGAGSAVTVMGERDLVVQSAQDLPRQVINVMGATRIDLSDAPPGVYELRVYNVMAELQVAVPYGTEIERTLWSLLSEVSIKPWKVKRSTRVRFTSHRVTLAGFSLMGEVTIREEPA